MSTHLKGEVCHSLGEEDVLPEDDEDNGAHGDDDDDDNDIDEDNHDDDDDDHDDDDFVAELVGNFLLRSIFLNCETICWALANYYGGIKECHQLPFSPLKTF